MAKHTPGPWFADATTKNVIRSSNGIIATADGNGSPDIQTDNANAKLMAAAPAMLAKLAEHLAVLSVIDSENPIIAETEKLIEKITE